MSCSDCGKPNSGVKPPPIRLNITGFDTHAGMGEDLPVAEPINWLKVTKLPAFEMFIAENFPNSGGKASGIPLTDSLFNSYCTWHANKGQWPDETPLGDLK